MDRIRAYLQLVRLPAVFTAMADILLGYLLTHRVLSPPSAVILLLAASSCLYLSGMVFNDVFDRDVDARERPGRPIPSGHVALRSAVWLGGLLVLAGLTAAAAAGRRTLEIGLLLTVCILAYDGYLKRTMLGPVVMGACRFLNVMLGASATFFVWARPQIYVAAALGIYIAGVTWFARQEGQQSSRRQLAGALGVIYVGLGAIVAFVASWPGSATWPGSTEPGPSVVVLPLVIVVLTISRRAFAAVANPSPERVQTAVRLMLLSLVMLDALLIFFHTADAGYAVLTASLILPAVLLGRWIYIT